jgi:hypothetical protein
MNENLDEAGWYDKLVASIRTSCHPAVGNWWKFQDKINQFDSFENIPQDVLAEVERRYNSRLLETSTLRKIESLDELKDLNGKFISPEKTDFLRRRFPNAEYFIFKNFVGESPNVVVVGVDNKKYVPKSIHSENYESSYLSIFERENRPVALFFSDGEKKYGLFEFVGGRTVDYSNFSELEQVVRLGVVSSARKTMFDPNPGNLVVDNGRVFYIDEGLTYCEFDSLGEAVIRNFKSVCEIFPRLRPFESAYIGWFAKISDMFRKSIESNLDENERIALMDFGEQANIKLTVSENLSYLQNGLKEVNKELLVSKVCSIFQ